MCYNCGCGDPNDDMGDPKNITNQTIEVASKANNMTLKSSLEEIEKLIKQELSKEE